MTAVLPEFHSRLIDSDLNDPSAELRFEPEIGQRVEGFEHGFLGDLFCIGWIIQHTFGGQVDSPFVRTHKLVKSFLLAATNSLNELGFAFVELSAWRCHVQDVKT